MKVIWANSTLSGLCDRLVDLFLMSAFAKIMNFELTVLWRVNQNFSENQLRTWGKARFVDYRYENLSRYFSLPSKVKIITEDNISSYDVNDHLVFPDYLGGIYNPSTFHEKYLKDICSLEDFEAAHASALKEFLPTKFLLEILGILPDIDVGIHLRRGDKVDNVPEALGVSKAEIENLNFITKQCTRKLASQHDTFNVFVCSDDASSLLDYKKWCSESGYRFINLEKHFDEVEKTYVDLFLLMRSKNILMSQKHSNFSFFASQASGSRLVYFYKDNLMVSDVNLKNKAYYLDLK